MLFTHSLGNGQKWGAVAILFTALTLAFTACKKEDSAPPTVQTITEQINTNSKFTLLKAALAKSGLDVTLGSAGTYTLLAPTDDAFKAFGLSSEAVIGLAPAELVKSVMQYHVLGTKLESSAIPSAINSPQQTQFPLGSVYFSKPVAVTTSAGSTTTVSVNGAHVLENGTQASNGIIYPIDRILLPPVYGDIPTTISQIPTIYALLAPTAGVSFKLLQQAVAKVGTGISSALTATGPLTVFAPTDNAFKASGFDSTAIAKAPVATLAAVLSYHVLNNNRAYTPILTNGSSLTTLQGGTITVGTSTTATTVTGKSNGGTASNIIGPDVTASNGVIQIIDRLLLP
ncbi:fasciclin domain-containing protein [Spirosoma sp. KNUC1025]|uniref:fasciclin domain-containing protein n=1 Tax=Spirosoma sp. KNUC1025 TaxID=2894082 RepID=UPI00386A7C63|nr:fasciclin domain-containing protein [Spirosoma sp. KNUC1025]